MDRGVPTALLTIFSTALLIGCGGSSTPTKPVAKDTYRISLTQLHSNATERAYSLDVEASFPFDADLTSGSNFSHAGRSKADTNGNHVLKGMRFTANREPEEGSKWHRDHTGMKTASASIKSSISVRLDHPMDQTLLLTATNGTYRSGAPLRLGTHEDGELKLLVNVLPD